MGSIKMGKMVLGMLETNCYYIYDDKTREAIVIDPAKNGIYDRLKEEGLSVKAMLLTHGHFDHIMGIHELAEKSGAQLFALEAEDALCRDAKLNASEQIRRPYTVEPDVLLKDGQELTLCGIGLSVTATPGHTSGSCCYYVPQEKMLFTGDTLFCGSVGRSDFPTGSEEDIVKSAHKLMDKFEDDVKVYPGHGESTTIGRERQYNPFCS